MKRILPLFFAFLLFTFPVEVFAQATQVATLSLDPATGTFNQGCTFSVNVKLDTGGVDTDGTDAIVLYDASRMTATSVNSGTIYPDYPGNNIDAQGGKITISGLASVSTPFNGSGVLATINFTIPSTAATGATQVKFDFDPNNKAKTTDSNVVQRGTVVDVLNTVVNGNYTIGTGACGTQAVSTAAPATIAPGAGAIFVSTPSAQQKSIPLPTKAPILPPAGSEQTTFMIAIIGGVLTVLGILGLAFL